MIRCRAIPQAGVENTKIEIKIRSLVYLLLLNKSKAMNIVKIELFTHEIFWLNQINSTKLIVYVVFIAKYLLRKM